MMPSPRWQPKESEPCWSSREDDWRVSSPNAITPAKSPFQDDFEGIISERDYARKVILEGRSSKDTLVREIMTSSVVTVTLDHTVDLCMKIMTERRVRNLPVVDRDNVVGIESIGDMVRATIAAQAETIDHLHTYILGTTYPS